MKRTTPVFILKSLPIFAALFLGGCLGTCRIAVHSAGVYSVTYIDRTSELEVTSVIAVGESGFLILEDCARVVSVDLLPPPPPPPPPNRAPVCTEARPSIASLPLDPANFTEVSILGVTDPEGDPFEIEIDSIRQDEPTGGLFPEDLTPDSGLDHDPTARLRNERDPSRNGRVYTLDFTAREDDPQHGECTATVRVCVPIVAGGMCVDDGPLFDSSNRPTIDITAVMSDSPDPITLGSDLTYTVTATNSSSLIATNVQVLYVIPDPLDFVSAPPNCNQGFSGGSPRTLGCILPPLAAGGGSAAVSIVVRPTATGSIAAHAEVRPHPTLAAYSDPDRSNSTPGVTTTVNPPSGADLAVTMTDSPDPVVRGGQVTYTTVVTNNGPLTANGVRVTGALPFAEFNAPTPTQGSCSISGLTYTCNLGTLANGATATITIPAFPFALGTLNTTASVTANEPDSNISNNSAAQTTTVIAPDEAVAGATPPQRNRVAMLLVFLGSLGSLGLIPRRRG